MSKMSLSGPSSCGKLSEVFADGASTLLYFGQSGPADVKLLNGAAYMYLGFPSAVTINLMDGASKLRVTGSDCASCKFVACLYHAWRMVLADHELLRTSLWVHYFILF